ncbi:MAG: hypothetical protein IPF59_00040 [Ignavibacteria bacterium]|nr:hypothetical protein [Ignavibacteria bacterium]MBK6418541.1 hypothetical protein [Ignavibacteria bacterium]MBK7411540.1 hypothetical protein [Ignavibacteria bacterium]
MTGQGLNAISNVKAKLLDIQAVTRVVITVTAVCELLDRSQNQKRTVVSPAGHVRDGVTLGAHDFKT